MTLVEAHTKQEGHQSVLLHEVIEALAIRPNDTVVDGTIGGAGHFTEILHLLGEQGTLVGIDADSDAVQRARLAAKNARASVETVQGNFRDLSRILHSSGIQTCDKILLDLGWSGYQLSSGKGFSFGADEPLLMSYGAPESVMNTGADIVNTYTERELADLIYTYGEEPKARIIARAIVEARSKERIISSQALGEIIAKALSSHRGKRHPATQAFQALRIAVNDEYGALREGITASFAHLAPSGRLAVITFHSAEDRIVKQMFRDHVAEGKGSLFSKKPIVPSYEEVRNNPRARSAKLRVFINR